jgi:predicted phage terminase large subunit-like protein
MFDYPSADFHHEIISDLSSYDEIKYMNYVAPRGSAKTSLCAQGWPLYHTFMSDYMRGKPRKPHFTVIVSKSLGHSTNTLTTIKNILDWSPTFRKLHGYHGSQNAKVWTQDKIILDTGDIFIAKGMIQHMRGMNIFHRRPDLIILDDVEDESNTKTLESIDFNTRWVLQTLIPMLAKNGRVINIGTPQHQKCLVFNLRDIPSWTSRHYKALNKGPGGEDVSIWPENYSVQDLLDKKRDMDEIGRVSVFYREYQCEVVGDEEALFKPEYMKYWDGELKQDSENNPYIAFTKRGLEEYEEPVNVPVNVFMGVDPASSTSAMADYSAILFLAMDPGKNIYVVDYFRERMPPMQVGDKIIEMFRKYGPRKSQIETTGYQDMLRQYVRSKQVIPGFEIKNNPRRGKAERIEGISPLFAGGKVFIRPEMVELVDEFLLFPRGKHDDIIDAFYYAVKGAYRPYHDIILKSVEPDKYIGGEIRREDAYDWMVE